jgi:uncharacterized membrane protein
MKREQFLRELTAAIGDMPADQIKEILYDYEEHFDAGAAQNKSEDAIAQSLGNPRIIGASYRVEAMLTPEKRNGVSTATSIASAVLATISLTMFNLIFLVGPFFIVLAILFALWACSLSLVVSGVFVIGYPFFCHFANSIHYQSSIALIQNPALSFVFLFTFGLGVAALGVLASTGMIFVTKSFFLGVASYLKINMRIVRGEK